MNEQTRAKELAAAFKAAGFTLDVSDDTGIVVSSDTDLDIFGTGEVDKLLRDSLKPGERMVSDFSCGDTDERDIENYITTGIGDVSKIVAIYVKSADESGY